MKKIFLVSVFAVLSATASANDNAKRLTASLLNDDISSFANDDEAQLENLIPRATASKLINEYEENQFKYEKKYARQLVNIKTVASGVKTTLTGVPYVIANGKNSFEWVSLYLKNPDDALNIDKGAKINFICMGTKSNIVYPDLKKCVDAEGYLATAVSDAVSGFDKLKINSTPKTLSQAIYLSLWRYDEKKPGALDKFNSLTELQKNKELIDEVLSGIDEKEAKLPLLSLPKL